MPLPGADEGMALFPQPQLLQGYANADLQKLNAARWICFNPRRPARRQANPPYLLPAYTLTSRARKSLENSVDPNRDPNADRSGKHRTIFARCFLRLRGFFLSDPRLCGHEPADLFRRIGLHVSCSVAVGIQREASRVVPEHTRESLDVSSALQGVCREAMPLRYNYDKPEKPRISRVFGYLARFFILFQTEKSSREVVIS